MSKPFNGIPDFRKKEDKQPKEVTLTFKPCCVCHTVITTGYYGRVGDGGVCSRKCDAVAQDMQLYLSKE